MSGDDDVRPGSWARVVLAALFFTFRIVLFLHLVSGTESMAPKSLGIRFGLPILAPVMPGIRPPRQSQAAELA